MRTLPCQVPLSGIACTKACLLLVSAGEDDDAKQEHQASIKELGRAIDHLDSTAGRNVVFEAMRIKYHQGGFTNSLDLNRHEIACNSGVMEFDPLQLRPGRLKDRISKQVNADFRDPNLPTPNMDELLRLLFGDDEASLRFLHKLLGCGLPGHNLERIPLLLQGGCGANTHCLVSREL